MSTHEHEHEHHPVAFYLGVGFILAVITFVELGPLFEWFNLPVSALLILSALKFVMVAVLFMHLWDDAPVFSQIFFIPLVGAGAMVTALIMLHANFAPSAREDVVPIQERYWTDYSGQCTSWLRSSISNRWYCASPAVDSKRLAMYADQGPGVSAGPTVDFASMSPEEARTELMAMGEKLYQTNCSACHQANGQGIPGAFPPIAGSDYPDFLSVQGHVRLMVQGLSGEIVVNGVTYNGAMQAFGQLSDAEIAAIATYERNSWGNDLGVVMPADVARYR